MKPFVLRTHSVLPGFNLALGITLLYLGVIVLIPLSAAFIKTAALSWAQFWDIVTAPRVVASYKLTFGASFLAATINAVFGLIVAWVLVRYKFPGKRVIDALVDLPFALPTAVAGIALTALYSQNGWIGQHLPFKVSFTPIGVFVALTFIGLPFVVRTLQPVLLPACIDGDSGFDFKCTSLAIFHAVFSSGASTLYVAFPTSTSNVAII